MATTADPAPAASAPAASVPATAAPVLVPMSRREVMQALSGLFIGIFVAVLASTIVSNALPVIIPEIGGSQSVYTWVVAAELLAMTATVPLWGKLADLFDQKLLLQISFGLFAIGSLLAGLAQDTTMLIVARVLQGMGAGGLTALVQIVMAAMIPVRQLGRYAGVFGAIFGVGTVGGPLIGGVIVDTSWLGWRWCFLFGVPFTLLSMVLVQRTLHLPAVARRRARIDWLGALLLTSGVSLLLVWVTFAGEKYAWASVETVLMVGGTVVLLGATALVERRVSEPVLPLGILGNRTVKLSVIASALVGLVLFGATVFLAQYLQISLGYSPTTAGLLSLPLVGGSLVSSTVAGWLITRTGRWKGWLVAGGVLVTTGFLCLSTIDAQTAPWLLGIFMGVLGLGVGMMSQNLVLAAQNDVPAAELGAATSIVSFARSLGGTVGVSALGAVLAGRVSGDLGVLGGDGGRAVPDVSTLPDQARVVVENAYGDATAALFLMATPLAVLLLVVVLFIQEKALRTTSGAERLAQEQAQVPLR